MQPIGGAPASSTSDPLDGFSWPALVLAAVVGVVFFVVQFPRLITRQIAPAIENGPVRRALFALVHVVQSRIEELVGTPAVGFKVLMALSFLALFVYLFVVVAWAVSRLDGRPLGLTLLGIAVGLAAVHAISWALIVGGHVFTLSAFLFAAMVRLAGWLVNLLLSDGFVFMVTIVAVVHLWVNRRNLLQAVVGLLIAAAVIAVAYFLLPALFAWLKAMLFWIWSLIDALLQPVLAFLRYLLSPLFALLQWIAVTLLAPVFAFVVTVIAIVLTIAVSVFAGLLVFGLMGHMVTDQVRSAFRVRLGGKNFLLNGFALGSALALVMLSSVAAPEVSNGLAEGWRASIRVLGALTSADLERSWLASVDFTRLFVATMPRSVHEFASSYLVNAQPPIADAFLLLVLLLVSTVNVFLGLVGLGGRTEPARPITFVSQEVALIVFFLIAGVALLLLQGGTEGG